MRACENCGKVFQPTKRGQRFCSGKCNREWYHWHGKEHPEDDTKPIIREFECRTCGKDVKVVDYNDQRTVYCSQQCEKKYWRDRTRHSSNAANRGRGNTGMSGWMSLGSLIRREARDLW